MKAKKPLCSSSSKPLKQGETPLRPAGQMPVIHSHAAGIDVGATAHWVCVPEDAVPAGESPVREFGAFTKDLDELVEWLLKCGVKTVVMESTSVYWIPLFQKLEAAGFRVSEFIGLGPRRLNRRLDFVFGTLPSRSIVYMGSATLPGQPLRS